MQAAACSYANWISNDGDANFKLSSVISLLFIKLFRGFEMPCIAHHMNTKFEIRLWFKRKIFKVTSSTLRQQWSFTENEFENYEVANFWPIFPQYIGMRFLPVHAVSVRKFWILLKIMNVNVKSKYGNCDSKIYLHHVKQVDLHGIRRTCGMITHILWTQNE